MIKFQNGFQISLLISMTLFIGCFDPPEFPVEPTISFERIRYINVEGGSDSLILSFNFEDGDGDIGLNSNQSLAPFHSFNLVIDSRDSLVTFSDSNVQPPFFTADPLDNIVLFSESDNRPQFNCNEWFINGADEDLFFGDLPFDTIYVQPNVFNKNIYIDFFRKSQGEYTLINNELSPGDACTEDFDARIPVFDSDNVGRSLSGTINYALLSQGFPILFRNDTIKLEFFIYDQALNRSNVAETPDFVLANITR